MSATNSHAQILSRTILDSHFLKISATLSVMSTKTIYVRCLLLHYWKKRLSQRDATDAINKVEGEETTNKSSVGEWFKRFNDGDFNLEDKPRSGRPSVLEESDLQAELAIEPSSSTRELATELGVDQKTVWNHLKKLDFAHKKPRQDPHELTEAQGLLLALGVSMFSISAQKRLEICRQLLQNPIDYRFWKRIVTSDEKWVFLVNHDRSKQWTPKGQNPPSVPKHSKFRQFVHKLFAFRSVWKESHDLCVVEL